MNTKQTFSILFWIEKRRLKNGKGQIWARITVNGKRAEISTHRQVSILEWDSKFQTVNSKSQEAKETNNHLATVKAKILQCQSKLEARNVEASAEAIKDEYIGKKLERTLDLSFS